MAKGSALVGIIVVLLVLGLGVVTFWFVRGASLRETASAGQSAQIEVSSQVCIQVVTPAINETSGECKEFATPCDVPNGWGKVTSCPVMVDTSNWKTYSPTSRMFELLYPDGWTTSARQTTINILNGERLITQVQFDEDKDSSRGPQGFLYGKMELSWIGNLSFEEVSSEEFANDYFSKGDPILERKKFGEIDAVVVKHSMCPANGGCLDYVVKNGSYFYDLRLLKQPVSAEDQAVAEVMLSSWRFKQ